MSVEAPKSEKARWQEVKRSGSEKQRRRAVSVQIGRIAEKVLDESEGLDSEARPSHYSAPAEYAGIVHQFHGPRGDSLSAFAYTPASGETHRLVSSEKTKTRVFREPKTEKTISVEYFRPGMSGRRTLEVDPEGKRQPKDSASWAQGFKKDHGIGRGHDKYVPTATQVAPTPEEMISHAAPVLRHMKREIDSFSKEPEEKKAA